MKYHVVKKKNITCKRPSGIRIHPTIWPQRTWAENWGLCFFWQELGPHLTYVAEVEAYPHAKFELDPLIHLTVWPQYINVTDRTDRTTVRQHIGRTVLQTVVQKLESSFSSQSHDEPTARCHMPTKR